MQPSSKQGSVYVMDEPTTGLHLSDIGLLIGIIDRLVDARNTVILIEHHLDVIRQADWIIDQCQSARQGQAFSNQLFGRVRGLGRAAKV